MWAANSKQGTLADLKGVLEVLEELRNIFFHLAESFHIGINLPQQEVHNVEDVLAHRTGQSLWRHGVLIAVCTKVFYERADAVVLVGLVADRSRVLLWSCCFLAIRAGSSLNPWEGGQSAVAWPGS